MIRSMWKLVSLILAIIAFLVVGVTELLGGEELVWAVGKAVASFFVCWFVLGYLGNMLTAVLERQDVIGASGAGVDEKG